MKTSEYEWCWWGDCYCKYACTKKSQGREHCDKDKSDACPAGLHIHDDDFEEDEESENHNHP